MSGPADLSQSRYFAAVLGVGSFAAIVLTLEALIRLCDVPISIGDGWRSPFDVPKPAAKEVNMIAKVDEGQPTQIPASMYPPAQSNAVTHVSDTQGAAEMCTMGGREKLYRHQ